MRPHIRLSVEIKKIVLQLVSTISKTGGMSVLPVVSAGDPELLRVFRRPTKTNTFKEFVGEL